MSTLRNIKLNRIPIAFKYLLVIGVVVFISFLYENTAKFKYHFEEGKRWKYNDLIAPFPFAIKKTEAELDREYKRVEEQFTPYYQLDADIAEQQIRAFEEAFQRKLNTAKEDDQFPDVTRRPNKYLEYGKNYLDEAYSKGILKLDPQHYAEDKDFVINIREGNRITAKTLENLNSLEEVQEDIGDKLPFEKDLPEADFLYDLLEKHLVFNLFYDPSLSEKEKQDMMAGIPLSRGKVDQGELIVPRNGIINPDTYQKLVSFKEQYEKEIASKKSYWGVLTGYFLLTTLIIGVFLVYILTFFKSVFDSFKKLVFILMWVVLYSYLVYLVEQTGAISAYIIPFAIVPIVVKTFYNDRLALFIHIIIVLLASFLSSLGYEFTFLQILIGIVVVLSDVNTRDWSKFFYSIFYIFITYVLGYVGLTLIQEGSVTNIDLMIFSWLFLNVFFTLLAYPLIPLLERFFGFTSAITLVELSDMNRPLLQKLSLEAPGTLQHSLQVANLAEAASQKIGANPLLVKVAALYHDIGKVKNPQYFIENQGKESPHSEISNLESAEIIIDHVKTGVEMAKKHRLPNLLINFIKTHHGTTRVEYFYRNHIKENPDQEFDESLFRYPGPRPTTKEETILMLADSIEAACKSLKEPSEQNLLELVDKIVTGKINNRQLEESEITFKELEQCIAVFKQVMKSVHHVRIVYPAEKK